MNHDIVESLKKQLNKISDHYGLISPGLTCYLNSVLQVLFMTEEFRDKIKSQDITSIDKQLKALFIHLEKNKAPTHEITQRLGITDVYEQRDAAEYFEKILRLTSPNTSTIFKGELNHLTKCCWCKERSDAQNFFWMLPLSLEDPYQTYSVKGGLDAFFKEDKVSGENKFYCTRCEKKQEAIIKYDMTQPPDVLTLLLKRFHYDDELMSYVKLDCKAEVPFTLHIKNCTYQLYAMVNHFGTLTGGHYVAYIHSFQTGEWYCFDDATVTRERHFSVNGKTSVRSRTSYLLMYKKNSSHPDNTSENEQEPDSEETYLTVENQLKDVSCNGSGVPKDDGQEDCMLFSETWTNQMNAFLKSHQTDMETERHRLASPRSQRKQNCPVNSLPQMSHMRWNSTVYYQDDFSNKQFSSEKSLKSKSKLIAEDIYPASGFGMDLNTCDRYSPSTKRKFSNTKKETALKGPWKY